MDYKTKYESLVKQVNDSLDYYNKLNMGFTAEEGAYYDGMQAAYESLKDFIDEELS
jgi:hypothetical protein